MALLTRRELTILLFALSVFLVAYNFQASVSSLTLTSSSIADLSASTLLSVQNAFREDGRRLPKLTDELEVAVLGDWEIDARKVYDLGPAGVTVDQQHEYWSNGNIPSTELVAHVPGYTILDKVLLANGTLYLVSDHTARAFPKPEAMVSTELGTSDPPVLQDLKFVTRRQAIETLGYTAHRVTGASLVCFDHPHLVDSRTLLALQRAYSTLATSSSSSTPLVPPSQTIFVNTKRTDIDKTGYTFKLARLAYPFMGHLFAEDWDDIERSARPVIFDRVLLADRTSAEQGAQSFDFSSDVVSQHIEASENDVTKSKSRNEKDVMRGMTIEATDKRLSFAPAFALPVLEGWAQPLHEGALTILGTQESEKGRRKAVTYVSTQGRRVGPRLRNEDHNALVRELRKLGAAQKWDVYVVELGGEESSSWKEHVSAAAQSSVMLSVYGDSLTNSVLMRAGPPSSTIIEFFPDGKFTNENEFVARSLGIQYVAWRNTKKYPRGSLPPISPPTASDSRMLSVDVSSVVAFVKEQLKRS